VGPSAVLDAVAKVKIPSLRRESNPRTPIVQPVARDVCRVEDTKQQTWRCTRRASVVTTRPRYIETDVEGTNS
jgi:hypothetical protein